MTFLFALAGLCVTGVFLLIHAAIFAPEGYEDAEGFHVTANKKAGAQTPASNPLTAADMMFFSR